MDWIWISKTVYRVSWIKLDTEEKKSGKDNNSDQNGKRRYSSERMVGTDCSTAGKPIIPHSFCSSEILAHIIYEKIVKAVPLHRQEKDFKSKGIILYIKYMDYLMMK